MGIFCQKDDLFKEDIIIPGFLIMKEDFKTKGGYPIRLSYYFLGAVALWSVLIGLSLTWILIIEKSGTLETARIEAQTAFEKDVIYRRWNAEHGGLYAPVTSETQPNPYYPSPNVTLKHLRANN